MSEVIDTQRCPAHLPRYIRNLNAWAASFGLRVKMAIYEYDNDPEPRVWAKWSGTRAQLLGLVAPLPSYRLPLRRGHLVVPNGARSAHNNRLLEGDVTIDGDQVALEIDFGPPVYTVANKDDIETIAYAEETVHHGTVEALLAMGVSRDRLPTKKRRRRDYDGYEWVGERNGCYKISAGWSSTVQPDGQLLYCVDTSLRVKRREAEWQEYRRERRDYLTDPCINTAPDEAPAPVPTAPARPSYLRLVVDNTRPRVRP